MSLIDFILNVAGLLLWLNWRAVPWMALPPPGTSLAATLKAAEPPRPRWFYIACLGALVFGRSFFYWEIGPSLHWNPGIPLGPVTLAFRSDVFGRMALFSFLSFAGTLGIFYLWLILLSALNSGASDANPQQRLVRLHLGPLERWPNALKLLLPLCLMVMLWWAFNPLLAKMNMVPKSSAWRLLAQGAVIGLAIYLALKFLVIGMLILHLINSYLYLGEYSFWKFVNTTARGLLRPFKLLPLQFGKVDFAPLLAIVVVALITELGRRSLLHLYLKLT